MKTIYDERFSITLTIGDAIKINKALRLLDESAELLEVNRNREEIDKYNSSEELIEYIGDSLSEKWIEVVSR